MLKLRVFLISAGRGRGSRYPPIAPFLPDVDKLAQPEVGFEAPPAAETVELTKEAIQEQRRTIIAQLQNLYLRRAELSVAAASHWLLH